MFSHPTILPASSQHTNPTLCSPTSTDKDKNKTAKETHTQTLHKSTTQNIQAKF